MAIHNCRYCGSIVPYEGAICDRCKQKFKDEKQQSSGGVTPNPAGAGCLKAYASCLLKLLKAFGVLLLISAAIWVVLFFVFDAYKIDYTVTGEASRTADEFTSYLLELDNTRDVWEIQYEKKNTGVFGRLAFWDKDSYTIRYNKGETVSHTTFVFKGENLGTGLPDGTYILTKIDGADVLIEDDYKLIHSTESEFYKTYAPKLQEITHDALLGKIIEKVEGGEHGLVEEDPPREAIFTENAVITARLVRNDPEALMDHGFEARGKIGDSDEWDVYQFTYGYSSSVRDIKLDGYDYAD